MRAGGQREQRQDAAIRAARRCLTRLPPRPSARRTRPAVLRAGAAQRERRRRRSAGRARPVPRTAGGGARRRCRHPLERAERLHRLTADRHRDVPVEDLRALVLVLDLRRRALLHQVDAVVEPAVGAVARDRLPFRRRLGVRLGRDGRSA